MSRTLIVTNDFPPTIGGIQSYARDYAALLDPEEVIVFASTQDAVAAVEFDDTVNYTVIRWPRSMLLPSPAAAQAIGDVVKEYDVDTVWFMSSVPLGLLSVVVKRAGVRAVVCSTHGHEVGWSMSPLARQALRVVGLNSTVVTYVSQYTLSRVRNAVGAKPAYRALPPGVDVDFFRPVDSKQRNEIRSTFGFSEDEVLMTCVSRLVRRKGQDQLIGVLADLDATLVIVGDGPDRRRLERLADAAGVRDRVRFLGEIDREDMRDVLAASDIAAMPARTRGAGLDVEGLGIVYLEAQACGIPVVAGRSGGAPETVGDGAGCVVNGRDRNELRRTLTMLIDDPLKRQDMGQRGRDHVVKNWSWERQKQRLAEVVDLCRHRGV